MRCFKILLLLLVCIASSHAQTWKPAIIFTRMLGEAIYIPNIGECGYVQFRTGPDGVAWGIYDLKTLSDTSTVRWELTGPVADRKIYKVLDIDGNGQMDVAAGLLVYLNACTPNQRIVHPILETGFDGGCADINGDGSAECMTREYPRLITLDDNDTIMRMKKLSYRAMHLGTINGMPRFLSLHGTTDFPARITVSVETVDPNQLHPDSAQINLIELDRSSSVSATWTSERLFTFPDVWYLPTRDSMWVITSDTVVTAPLDQSLGYIPNHLGQDRGFREHILYFAIDGTRIDIVGTSQPVNHIRYTRLHSEGTRLWAEAIATIRMDTLKDGRKASLPDECAVVGDIDADGLPDVLLTCGDEFPEESRLYLTTGRTMTAIQESIESVPLIQRTPEGWEIPVALCGTPTPQRAAIYNVQGSLFAMADVVMETGNSNIRIHELLLPTGAYFAVIGSCVVRLQ